MPTPSHPHNRREWSNDRGVTSGRDDIATVGLRPLRIEADEPVTRPIPPILPTYGERYAAQARLGAGGMAVVMLARDLRLERLVALKVLHRELLGDPEHVERFRREALMLAMIESPFVVPVYDVAIGRDEAYMVMRFVPGRSLADEVAGRAPITPRRAASIVLGVLDGVRELHVRRLVHRDLKLANVMLGDDGRPVLLDLGVALDRQRPGVTRPGFVAGTLEVMAPEQKAGIEADERADVFAAGTILAQLATVRETVGDDDLARIPPMLASVIRAATAPLDQRYRSASEMAAALGSVVRTLGGR